MNFASLEYFEKLPTGSFHTLRKVVENPAHPFNSQVISDLNSISHKDLEEWAINSRIERLIVREENKDLATRIWYLDYYLSKAIANKRLSILKGSNKNERPMPYNKQELLDLSVDENGLVNLRNFDCSNFGLTYKNHVYQLCPSLDQYNSCHWLTGILIEETFQNNKNFRIRLDPLVEVPRQVFRPYFQYMVLYGKALDWNRLKLLKEENFGQWLGDGLSTKSIMTTDYVWSPSAYEVHFTCEELPNVEWLNFRGSRYFHAIFSKKTGKVIHCDGALRFYNEDEYANRIRYHVRHPEARKVGKRIKLFQIDEPIEQDLFLSLATNFLVWNEDALAYFNQ